MASLPPVNANPVSLCCTRLVGQFDRVNANSNRVSGSIFCWQDTVDGKIRQKGVYLTHQDGKEAPYERAF